MKFILISFFLFLVFGCSRSYDGGFNAPLLHKIDIQQGNVIDQEMLNKLQPGMDKKQVKFIMGTPVLVDPFHNERWEYIYSFQEGGKVREQRHITLHFENGKLAYISGDIEVSNIPSIFIGSEFFDALPIKQFIKKNNKWYERNVKFLT